MNSNLHSQVSNIQTKAFVNLMAIFNRCLLGVGVLLFSISLQAASSSGPQDDHLAIGEVSLVLGKAYLLSVDKPRQLLQAGSQIRPMDQIVTEANGHVHIRFIDKALVSVRPNSQLEITSYRYNSEQPEQSSFKFNLLEGVTRAVSGKGAKADRSRYRLNTPIAAIGVRGTDFVVSATDSSTRAMVNQGAIVLAPYSENCSAAALGPCNADALELTDNTLQMIELEDTALAPRLIPVTAETGSLQQGVQLALLTREADESESIAGADVHLESVAVNQASERVEATLPDFSLAVAVADEALLNRQLVWGRWADELSDLERITVSFDKAKQDREVTVGNASYILFRSESLSPQVDSGLGMVSFSLNSAQAFYNSDSGVVAMQVNGGNLDIDFDQSAFSTRLNLGHVDTGFIDFIANGSISESGYFVARSSSQHVAGSVSQDGREAGYFFTQQLDEGNISGLTLWGSQ